MVFGGRRAHAVPLLRRRCQTWFHQQPPTDRPRNRLARFRWLTASNCEGRQARPCAQAPPNQPLARLAPSPMAAELAPAPLGDGEAPYDERFEFDAPRFYDFDAMADAAGSPDAAAWFNTDGPKGELEEGASARRWGRLAGLSSPPRWRAATGDRLRSVLHDVLGAPPSTALPSLPPPGLATPPSVVKAQKKAEKKERGAAGAAAGAAEDVNSQQQQQQQQNEGGGKAGKGAQWEVAQGEFQGCVAFYAWPPGRQSPVVTRLHFTPSAPLCPVQAGRLAAHWRPSTTLAAALRKQQAPRQASSSSSTSRHGRMSNARRQRRQQAASPAPVQATRRLAAAKLAPPPPSSSSSSSHAACSHR